ncbi:MAG: hypothetical protein V1660_03370 [archaeon]
MGDTSGVERTSRYNIIGHTIEEIIPYHDGATIILSNGKELDISIDPQEITEPNHPKIVRDIASLDGKIYDIKYGNGNKAKLADYKSHLKELKSSLVGMTLTFNKKPCLINKVISKDDENSVIIEQDNKTRTVHLYSIEK